MDWRQKGGSRKWTQLYLSIAAAQEDASEYLEEAKLKELVAKYSEFINFPIYLYKCAVVPCSWAATTQLPARSCFHLCLPRLAVSLRCWRLGVATPASAAASRLRWSLPGHEVLMACGTVLQLEGGREGGADRGGRG